MSKESFGPIPLLTPTQDRDKHEPMPDLTETRSQEYQELQDQYAGEHPGIHSNPYSDTAKGLERGTLVPES